MDRVLDIKYEKLEDDNIDKVIEFYNSIHKSNRNIKSFNWEFKNAPSGKAIYIVAIDSRINKIVGSQCAIPILMKSANGELFLTAKSEDTLVDPEYRGLNIFDKMYEMLISECRIAGIKYLWGFTSAKKPFLKLGFEIPFLHLQSLCVLNTLNSYNYLSSLNKKNKKIDKFKIGTLVLYSKIKFQLFRLINLLNWHSKNSISYVVDNSFETITDDEMDSMIPKDSNYFFIKKSKEFLKWRVKDNPYCKKTLTILFKSKSVTSAMIIFGCNIEGVWYILDESYNTDLTPKTKSRILFLAIKVLRKSMVNQVDLIRNWEFLHNSYSEDVLMIKNHCGFVSLKRGIPFVWFKIDPIEAIDCNNIILSRLATQGMT